MHIVDHVFIILLFVVQPIYGALSYRRYLAAVKAGEPANRRKLYREAALLEWSFLAALGVAWTTFDRPLASLGFVTPAGAGFWGGAALLIAGCAYCAYAWSGVKRASDTEKAKQLDSLGDLKYLLPQTRKELHAFFEISITAGIVEEIVYRGFVLWYLAAFMPMWAAIAVSSVAFGLAHSYQGAGGALRTGAIGLVFAIFYVVTGSIWLPILAHAIFDIVQGAAVFELFGEDGEDRGAGAAAQSG